MIDAIKRLLAAAIVLLLLAAALWGCWRLWRENEELRRRHEGNVAALTSELETARFRDSLSQASARALELRASEAERLCGRLNEQLYDMGVRMRDVRSASATEVVVRDTVFFPLPLEDAADTCVTVSDPWADVTLCRGGGVAASVAYSVRDSVSTVVHVRYRRRFLFLRWRPEYRATSVSHNPRASIVSSTAVVVDE